LTLDKSSVSTPVQSTHLDAISQNDENTPDSG
jgi:hypothetical protein